MPKMPLEARVYYAYPLRCVTLLRRRLANDQHRVPWKQLWKLLNVFEEGAAFQEPLEDHTQELLEGIDKLQDPPSGLTEHKQDLEEIMAGQVGERKRFFFICLRWRRYAIWHHLRLHPADPHGAQQLMYRLVQKPEGRKTAQDDTSMPSIDAIVGDKESEAIDELVAKCRDRLKLIARWLFEHQEAKAFLPGSGNKGKRAENANGRGEAEARMQARHLQRCIEEIEPVHNLEVIISATRDWLDAFENRIHAYLQAKEAFEAHIKQTASSRIESQGSDHENNKQTTEITPDQAQSVTPPPAPGSYGPNAASPEDGVPVSSTLAKHDVEEGHPSVPRASDEVSTRARRLTIDRGTSPIVIERSVQHSIQISAAIDASASAIEEVQVDSQTSVAVQLDDTPPSPDSLPSPFVGPPPGQSRKRNADGTMRASSLTPEVPIDESSSVPVQFDTAELGPLPSSRSPDLNELNGISDEGRPAVTDPAGQPQETQHIEHRHSAKVRRTRAEDQAVELPPPPPEVQELVEKHALEAERIRREKRAGLPSTEYRIWDGIWERMEDYNPPPVLLPRHPNVESSPSAGKTDGLADGALDSDLDDEQPTGPKADLAGTGTFMTFASRQSDEDSVQERRERDRSSREIEDFLSVQGDDA